MTRGFLFKIIPIVNESCFYAKDGGWIIVLKSLKYVQMSVWTFYKHRWNIIFDIWLIIRTNKEIKFNFCREKSLCFFYSTYFFCKKREKEYMVYIQCKCEIHDIFFYMKRWKHTYIIDTCLTWHLQSFLKNTVNMGSSVGNVNKYWDIKHSLIWV